MSYTFPAFAAADANPRAALATSRPGAIARAPRPSAIARAPLEATLALAPAVSLAERAPRARTNPIAFVDDAGDESASTRVDASVMEEARADDEDDEAMNTPRHRELARNIAEANRSIERVVVTFLARELRGFAAGSARRVEERIDAVEDVVR